MPLASTKSKESFFYNKGQGRNQTTIDLGVTWKLKVLSVKYAVLIWYIVYSKIYLAKLKADNRQIGQKQYAPYHSIVV